MNVPANPDGNLQRKQACPHCGDILDPRQIYRHLEEFGQQFAINFVDDNDTSISDDAGGNEGLGPGDAMDADNGPGDAYQHGDVELAQLPVNEDLPNNDPALATPELGRSGLRRNPPVTIEDWPDLFELDSEQSDASTDEEHTDTDEDPKFVERVEPLRFNHIDEPGFTDDELLGFLQEHLGDMAEDEWVDLYSRILSYRDRKTIQLLATRLRTHFSRATWEDLRHGVCDELNIPSEFVAWRRLRILSGLETHAYDCCINSCCCFLGKYAALDKCPYCDQRRYSPTGKARRIYHYTPLIPQLRGMFQSRTMAAKLRYRANVDGEYEHGVFQDVFDGENYRALLGTRVNPNGEYHFFSNPEDIALGLSTDGFTLFKRRRRGLSTAWPIILVNYNLHPNIRTRLENILCVGVVPGPKQCKDLNSFLVPLLEELLELEDGVECSGLSPEGVGYYFILHAFIIIVFGDIPAVSKMLLVKGHNALAPCRTCYIQGVLCQLERSSVYYVPLRRPDARASLPFELLPMRTKHFFSVHLAQIEQPQPQIARKRLQQQYGLNARSIFMNLKSVDPPSSFPYEIMHLLFENLVPNMIRHWTGTFKDLDQGSENYRISEEDWGIIGKLTAQTTRTTPSAFVGTIPNIAEDKILFKAEAYSFWFLFIAPILLRGVLPRKYYTHFLLMREIIIRCLQLKITSEEIDELETMVRTWVTQYEEYYYQFEALRLPTCPLTIHALIHMPYYLRRTGPLWASWAFVMERFCGQLLPAVKNRTRPYEHLDNFVQRRAQMQVVSVVYDLPSLTRPRIKYKYIGGVEMSSTETMYPEFPGIVLGQPVDTTVELDVPLMNQFTKYFGVVYGLSAPELQKRIDPKSLVRYGRFRTAGDGDSIRTAILIDRDPIARDNSYVKYDLLPDRNAAYRNRADVPYRRTQYGRLMDIYYVHFIENNGTRAPYLLARVKECKTDGSDATSPDTPVVTYTQLAPLSIIHLLTIVSVVGRVPLNNGWGIIDRSRETARTQFGDDEESDDGDQL